MSPKTFFVTLLQIGLAAAVLLLSHYGFLWLAALLVLGPSVIGWLQGEHSYDGLLKVSPSAIVGLSVVILVGLSREPLGQAVFPVATQIVFTVLYVAWLIWIRQLRRHQQASLAVVALQQILGISALFLLAAFWHWPEATILLLVWAVVMVTTLWYLRAIGERAAAILAAAWALVAAQLSWILYAWQVNYILLGGALIVPQAALVISGVGYCFASIYYSHSQKNLSRRRLIEYVAISGVLLAIVIAGTRWNGTT